MEDEFTCKPMSYTEVLPYVTSAEGLRLPNYNIISDIINTFIMKNYIIVSASYMTVKGKTLIL